MIQNMLFNKFFKNKFEFIKSLYNNLHKKNKFD